LGVVDAMSRETSIPFDYDAFIGELKARIGAGRLAAARSVNHELVNLYWDIGAAIREKQAERGWAMAWSIGSPVI
jgi:hypothetical protein